MPEKGKGSRGRVTPWQVRREEWTASIMLAVALVVAYVRRQMRFYRLLLRDSRTPTSSKILLGAALGYAIWPLGLVPDFIPIVGYVDDIIIVPTLVCIAVRRVPSHVVDACRRRGQESSRPASSASRPSFPRRACPVLDTGETSCTTFIGTRITGSTPPSSFPRRRERSPGRCRQLGVMRADPFSSPHVSFARP